MQNRAALHLRLCLGCLVLLVTIPFLLGHHGMPISTFFEEWIAGILGLLAITAFFAAGPGKAIDVPEIAALPLGLVVLAGLQRLFLPGLPADGFIVFACYLVWALFLILLGRFLARAIGLQALIDLLAFALLAGALLEALTGIFQLFGIGRPPWIASTQGGGVLRGNLAQSNSLSDYLWLGVASAIYLRGRGRLGATWTGACLLPLLSVSVLSGSRSLWLYAAAIVALSLAGPWARGNPAARSLRLWAFAALAGSAFFQLAFSTGLVPLPESFTSAADRVLHQGARDPARLAFWGTALEVFLENPWFGSGVGTFPFQFYSHAVVGLPVRTSTFVEHAHNLLLHLLAEMGLAAGVLLLVLGGRWALGLLRAPRELPFWWIATVALILGIHSSLEYPLWYAYFLGIAALVAGAASQRNLATLPVRPFRLALALGLVAGAGLLASLHRDYNLLENTYAGRIGARTGAEYRVQADRILRRLSSESLLASYGTLGLATLMAEDASDLEDKLRVCDRVEHFQPSKLVVFKCAHLREIAGRHEDAMLTLRRAAAAYPDRAKMVLNQWAIRSWDDPVVARLVADFPPAGR